MLENKRIAVVVPAHDEAPLIERVVTTLPDFVDLVVVVDDGSHDDTAHVARRAGRGHHAEVRVLRHPRRRGPGATIRTGYRAALEEGAQVVAVMAGDGQMDPDDLARVVEPVLRGEADYAKGDRLWRGGRPRGMPLVRWLGIGGLTTMTRLVTGYRELRDAQSGYTAASAECLADLPLERLHPGYGYPNDLLILLRDAHKRVVDVPVRALYGVGERSELRELRVAPVLVWLLVRGALTRDRPKPREPRRTDGPS